MRPSIRTTPSGRRLNVASSKRFRLPRPGPGLVTLLGPLLRQCAGVSEGQYRDRPRAARMTGLQLKAAAVRLDDRSAQREPEPPAASWTAGEMQFADLH